MAAPLSDDTGQQMVVAMNAQTAALNAQTAVMTQLLEWFAVAAAERQRYHMCLQSGKPYVPNGPASFDW